jgi:hypothetical protein
MVDLEHSVGGLLGGIVSPLGWVGNAASIYADPDPVWEELTHMADQRGNFSWIQDNLARIPIGINIAVSDQLKLAAFLVGLKSMSETAAPGMLVWGTHAWKDVTYVVVSPSAAGRGQIPTDLYYLAAAEGLTITLDETVMQHAIERLVARRAALAAGGAGGLRPWVGDQVSAVMRPLFLAQLSAFEPNGGVSTWMYARMWNDVAILNEWHRLFPDQDPLAVHERLWKTRLVCPFGGTYRWNEDHLSMEATAVDPITDDAKTVVPAAFAGIASLSAGFGIEPLPALDVDAPPAKAGPHVARDMNDRSISIGLRARIEVESAAAK